MALTMLDKSTDRADKSAWPPAIAAEFEREKLNNNGCVGSTLLSESERETRHETYGPGEFKVHDLENLGDKEMVFMTIEFLNSANKPLAIPDKVRAAA